MQLCVYNNSLFWPLSLWFFVKCCRLVGELSCVILCIPYIYIYIYTFTHKIVKTKLWFQLTVRATFIVVFYFSLRFVSISLFVCVYVSSAFSSSIFSFFISFVECAFVQKTFFFVMVWFALWSIIHFYHYFVSAKHEFALNSYMCILHKKMHVNDINKKKRKNKRTRKKRGNSLTFIPTEIGERKETDGLMKYTLIQT